MSQQRKPPINVRRPTSDLVLPKPAPAAFAEERNRVAGQGTVERNGLLRQVGERMCPDGLRYVGSVACHYYVHKLAAEGFVQVQQTQLGKVPELLAVKGVQELSREVMQTFGHKPPAKLARAEAKETKENR